MMREYRKLLYESVFWKLEMMREYLKRRYESVFWKLEHKRAVSEYHLLLYEKAVCGFWENRCAERARKKTIESLKRDCDSIRSRRPLPFNDDGKVCIRISLRSVLSGDAHEALFPVGTTYYQFFNEVRVQFGFAWWYPISVAVTQLSGTPVEGKSEKKLEKELNDSTLLCRFYGVST